MDTALLTRVARSSPPWVRYMLTLSEIARSGNGWVIASGDDVAMWQTDAGPMMALWPFEHLASAAVDQGGAAAPMPASELVESLLPFLEENGISLVLFPNFENDVLVPPDAISNDLPDFVAEPVDVAEQLEADPEQESVLAGAMLEVPGDVETGGGEPGLDESPDASALPEGPNERYAQLLAAVSRSGLVWIAEGEDDSVGGVALAEREPAIAVFPDAGSAAGFIVETGLPAVARSVRADGFADDWMVLAFAAGWKVAISPTADQAAVVEPPRFALDLADAAYGSETS